MARVREKRTEWRMRGIEPNNKRNVVFPSSILPSRCYGNPPSPEGEGLIGCAHSCYSVALVKKSHTIETARCIYAPAYPPAVAHRREIPCKRNVARAPAHPRQPARPRWLTAEKSSARETGTTEHERPPNTCPWRIIEKTRPHEKTVTLSGLPFRLFQILGKFVESHSEYFKHTYNVI